MNPLLLSVLMGLVGLPAGALVNALADDLPARRRLRRPHCSRCRRPLPPGYWSAVLSLVQGGRCPACGHRTRRRALAVELACVSLLAALPWLVEPLPDVLIGAVYIAVLILVIVTDLEHRLILNVVTFPATAFALAASIVLSFNSLPASALGALVAFMFFYGAYRLGRRLFGPGALGFGDVTMATMLGAMLGLHQVIFALVLGILLAGLWSVVGIARRTLTRRSTFAYGPYLAVGGILMVLAGSTILTWYAGRGG
jgi:leader peptidase (prepilin peptidase)/N-methyltransferase